MKTTVLKTLKELVSGNNVAASKISSALLAELTEENLVLPIPHGSRVSYKAISVNRLNDYIYAKYNISNLDAAIAIKKDAPQRSEQIEITGNSKFVQKRTFTGFLVNTFEPLKCTLNGNEIIVSPTVGTFTFIYDFQTFTIPDDAIVIGIENAENFRYINRQKYLFEGIKCLFVSRYPQRQSNDLKEWLLSIKNQYFHFGDFDFAGLNIFVNEFKKHLGVRAKLFVPENLEILFQKYGNLELFCNQQIEFDINKQDDVVKSVYLLIEKYRKGLEQEIFIK